MWLQYYLKCYSFKPDPWFLDCGGWTPLWISHRRALFPSKSSAKPEHSRTPSWQQNVWATAALGLTLDPPFRLQISAFPEFLATRIQTSFHLSAHLFILF
jgi:hypothetical protein